MALRDDAALFGIFRSVLLSAARKGLLPESTALDLVNAIEADIRRAYGGTTVYVCKLNRSIRRQQVRDLYNALLANGKGDLSESRSPVGRYAGDSISAKARSIGW